MSFSRLRALAGKHPLIANALMVSGLFGAADASQQKLQHSRHYDWASTRRLALVGAFIHGPMYYVWYSRLDRLLPGTAARTIVKKVFLDQAIVGGLGAALFFGATATLEGNKNVLKEVKEKWPKAYLVGWAYWPAVQSLNFWLLPTSLRPLFVGSASFVWTNFLCWMKSGTTDKDDLTDYTSQSAKRIM